VPERRRELQNDLYTKGRLCDAREGSGVGVPASAGAGFFRGCASAFRLRLLNRAAKERSMK